MHRALGGAPVAPGHRSAPVGRGLTWRSLGRSLRGNFIACAAQLWLAPGAGGASHSVRTDTLLQVKK
jgi:hypothetical protein